MKNLFLLSLLCWVSISLGWSQTTILDFETAATSTTFQYFGSTLDGSLTSVIANPDSSAANPSDSVTVYSKPANSQTWAGAFSNPDPATAMDMAANDKICVKVWMDHIGPVVLKLENSTTGGANWTTTVSNTLINEWEELCFDVTLPSEEAPNSPAFGHTYPRVVLFFDFGSSSTDSVVSYFDDIVVKPAPASGPCNTVLDFEAAATTTNFQYFGSSLDGSLAMPIANPDPTGDNTSDSVMVHIKPGATNPGIQPWAGAFSNPNPTTAFDFTSNDQVCIKVWMPKLGSVALKFEEPTSGGANWADTLNNTVINQWEELCFDVTKSSVENNDPPASGRVFNKVVIFFEFNKVLMDSTVFYFDDICVRSSGAIPDSSDVEFAVDMNSYGNAFTQPYVRGTFNGWGTDNPLADADQDGIWTTTLKLPNGPYEYKFNLDDAVWEEFSPTDLCTVTDPSGQFVNRKLAVNQSTPADTFCFNSCYLCGEGVEITFNLGFTGVTPNTDGVWLAGGGNFDSPGSVYQLLDDGSGVYSITIERQKGFTSFYTYANGNCPDFSCKEDISGQACANPDNFNDRSFAPITQDTTFNECFATCVSCLTSIGDELTPDLFQVMPTQVFSQVTVVFGEETRAVKHLQVLNMNGQVVLSRLLGIGEQQIELDLAHLPAGLYFVQGRSERQFATQKIVKY